MPALIRPSRVLLLVQLVGTLAILFAVPNTILQTFLLLLLWAITFWPLTRSELVIFVLTCVLFTGADIAVVSRGIFHFAHPDMWGLPYYEPFVWGFYFLHSMRVIGGRPQTQVLPGLVFALLFVGTVSLIPDVTILLIVAGVLLISALVYFRTAKDFQYTGYLLLLGFVIETLGVSTRVWSYSIDNYVVWWAITWAASGLILYRAVMPVGMRLAKK
ncbi:MAG: hypothetical protein Q7S95_04125 [bacterium]|nr:hypothetical protein [bacterium]